MAGLRMSLCSVCCAVLCLWLSGCGGGSSSEDAKADLAVLDTLRRTDPSQGRSALKDFVDDHPEDELAWVNLGHAHEQMGELAEAETAYLKALEMNPKRFEALTGLGIVSRKRRDYDKAIAYYQRALAIEPNYAPAYSSMAVIALKQRRDRQALEYAQKAWQLDKTDPVIAANLAAAYHYLGQYNQRNQMATTARKLGYRNVAGLERVFSGEATLR